MAADIAVKVDNVSKTFRLPHEKVTSVKSAVVNFWRRSRTYEKQRVLSDISFEIKKGEFFGIVGRNGSGKSTLLKMLAGIYSPSRGTVRVNGKLTPFIELGVGFNPELSGRENVFLNGALLGFNRAEMTEMYDDIVAFAELERFMDQKLKNYSSGMQVRLAFSIAIRVKSDILMLDEVLAVGDEAFQSKCIKVFDDYKKNKQTIILVTHDMETVKKYCSKAMLLHDGQIVEFGSAHEVANKYSLLNQDTVEAQQQATSGAKSNIDLKIMNQGGGGDKRYKFGDDMKVKVSWPKDSRVDSVGVAIYASTGECAYATNTDIDNYKLKGNSVTYNVNLSIGAGNYFITAGTFIGKDQAIVDFISEGPRFSIKRTDNEKEQGIARLNHAWSED